MMRFLKSCILSIFVIFCLTVSFDVHAAEDSGMWGESIKWSYDEATNALTLEGNGEIPYTSQYYLHSRPWNSYSSKITNVIIKDGITGIGDCALMNCDKLMTVSIPESVTRIGGGVFYGCSSLVSLHLPTNVTEIGLAAFYNCRNLVSVNIPDAVTVIGDDAFYNCRSLTNVILPEGVSFNASFNGCSSLKNIILPDSITLLDDYAFWGCTSLSAINLSKNVQKIPNSAFYKCSSLVEIILHEGITAVGDSAFYECTSLTNISFPDSLTYIGENAFRNCSSVEVVTLPKYLNYLGGYAFCSCSKLESIEFPDSLTYLGDCAFQRCGLSVVELPEQLTVVPRSAFAYCDSLKAVGLPESVVLINSSAFSGCKALSDVYYSGTKAQWGEIVVHDYNDSLLNAKFHYNTDCIHSISFSDPIFATCTEGGMTAGSACTKCNKVFQKAEPTPAMGHLYIEGVCTRCGEEDPEYIHNPFVDVSEGDWFYTPVLWALGANVTGGKTANSFAPNEACTRAQVVTFLWAANGKPKIESAVNPFSDVSSSEWYYEAVLWAVENGITGGISADCFGPNQTCTRAQIATFLWAAEGKPVVDKTSLFSDVNESDWFAVSVIWAKQQGITDGIGEGKFGPNDICTRAQVVTFLNKVYG